MHRLSNGFKTCYQATKNLYRTELYHNIRTKQNQKGSLTLINDTVEVMNIKQYQLSSEKVDQIANIACEFFQLKNQDDYNFIDFLYRKKYKASFLEAKDHCYTMFIGKECFDFLPTKELLKPQNVHPQLNNHLVYHFFKDRPFEVKILDYSKILLSKNPLFTHFWNSSFSYGEFQQYGQETNECLQKEWIGSKNPQPSSKRTSGGDFTFPPL